MSRRFDVLLISENHSTEPVIVKKELFTAVWWNLVNTCKT